MSARELRSYLTNSVLVSVSNTTEVAEVKPLLARTLHESYNEIQTALDNIADDEGQDKDAVLEATFLAKKMEKLENVILTIFWNKVLSRFNQV